MIDRFSIRVMLGLVAGIGIAMAALRSPSRSWVLALFLAYLLLVLTATLGVIFTPGTRRSTWLGIAVFGWGFYFVSGQVPFAQSSVDLDAGIEAIFLRLHPELPRPVQPDPAGMDDEARQAWRENDQRLDLERSILQGQFRGIMHAMIGIGVSLLGGVVARRFEGHAPTPI